MVKQVNNVVIVGAGIMGVGIAQTFAQAGFRVSLTDVNQEILTESLAQIKANLELFNEYGLLSEEIAGILDRIVPVINNEMENPVRHCQYLVEVIPEILTAKRELFAQIEKYNPETIISSNTGSFTVAELSAGMKTPERLIGVHYFNPAHIIPAVEIHPGEKTSAETIETTRRLMLETGKKPVMVKKEIPGFIVNRLTGAMLREIGYLLDEGIVSVEDLDTAIKSSIGFRMACLGFMETEDMVGLDTSTRVSNRLFSLLNNASGPSSAQLSRVSAGMLGVKSGKGWYDYSGKGISAVLEANNRKLLSFLALKNNNSK